MGFVFFKILNCRTTRKDSRGSGEGIRAGAGAEKKLDNFIARRIITSSTLSTGVTSKLIEKKDEKK
jgi:hypothetical protein